MRYRYASVQASKPMEGTYMDGIINVEIGQRMGTPHMASSVGRYYTNS